MTQSLSLNRAPALARPVVWIVPVAAGIFVGALAFDALPAAVGALGIQAWAWFAAGLGLMILSTRVAGASGAGWAGWVASLGVWIHSLVEGVAVGTGLGLGLGGGTLLTAGVILHLIPESAALFTVLKESGVSARRALARCGVTWGLVAAGLAGSRLVIGGVPARPLGMAMGLAAGAFGFLAWMIWQQRSKETSFAWVGAILGFAWIAAIHL